MAFKFLIVITFCISLTSIHEEEQTYHKELYDSGKTKVEGWLVNGVKEGYWLFYHPNGTLSRKGHYKGGNREAYWYFYSAEGKLLLEGHYNNGQKSKWWLFYDTKGKINHKCQLSNGKKNGYCLKYVNDKLTSAEKFENGKQVKKWTDFSSFKRENKLSDLK